MLQAYQEESTNQEIMKQRWERAEAAKRLELFDEARKLGTSQRAAAQVADIPCSTIRDWDKRRQRPHLSKKTASFLETPEGYAFLCRVFMAALFVITLRCGGGIRAVCEFLRLSGLDDYVGPSFGSVHNISVNMEEDIIALGERQRSELGKNMKEKEITICPDENFHDDMCLVATEPVSGFIFAEKNSTKRDADTWTLVVNKSLEGLPVTVIQITSDQAKALIKLAKDGLEANFCPDLFHILHPLCQATSFPLTIKVRKNLKSYNKAVTKAQSLLDKLRGLQQKKNGKRDIENLESRIENAQTEQEDEHKKLEQALEYQDQMRKAIKEISTVFHPYSLADGRPQSAELIYALLNQIFDRMLKIADEASLSEKSINTISKIHGFVEIMAESICFVHMETAIRVFELDLPDDLKAIVVHKLIPGLYLRRVADKADEAEKRDDIRKVADSLLEPLRKKDHPLQQLAPEVSEEVESIAQECADIFQRSSSCTEGRNGQLSRFHHGLHGLSDRKLGALTVIHNYYIIRPDGTTAAVRFFDSSHDDLFEWLLKRMPSLPRPASKRKSKQKEEYTGRVLTTLRCAEA